MSSPMQVSPKWHQVLSAIAVVLTAASWAVGQLNAVDSVTLTGALAILMGLVEKL